MRHHTDPTYSERIALDDGHADVDTPGEHVELTVTLGNRACLGIALSPREAQQVGQALTTAAHRTAPNPFTSTLPRDDGPDWPATPARIFPSVPDHSEDLDVLALIEDDGPMVHIGGACLGAHEVRALVDHLAGILAAADQAVTP